MRNDLEGLLRTGHLPKQKTCEADGEQQQEHGETEDLCSDGLFEGTRLRPDSVLGGFHRSREFRAVPSYSRSSIPQGGENVHLCSKASPNCHTFESRGESWKFPGRMALSTRGPRKPN